MNSEFFQFLELCGIEISETSDVATLISEYNNFNKYHSANPKQTFEHNFIKWQNQQRGPYEKPQSIEPQPRTLQPDHVTTPIKLQTLKESTPYIGDFLSYTFVPSPKPQQQQAAVANGISNQNRQ
ncbi:Hypothetical predicted protein [Paramuricea clavata]|uniref:Uncharacterized protein n=1 Tax=Paramuricea clavata TaxID=317549 RepID=A0A7D9I4Z7_PARCT|nr:Hypothetical predicted protein [Paramuricea clavata]